MGSRTLGTQVIDTTNRILICDDDLELCELLKEYLTGEGFSIDAVQSGTDGVERAQSGDYRLVVLDVMLPGIDGFEVLRRIRARSTIPILMLTARGEDTDRIMGLESGADDYLSKPFNPRELVARLRAILRRLNPPAATDGQGGRLVVGDVELDPGAREVTLNGEALILTATEFDLLELLLRSAGHVVERQTLSRTCLGRELEPFDRSIDMHVSHIRRKLGRHRSGIERLKACRGVGYIYTHPADAERG